MKVALNDALIELSLKNLSFSYKKGGKFMFISEVLTYFITDLKPDKS